MKLISLNIWGGQLFEPLLEFIQKHSLDTDIFCFQEVFNTTTDRDWDGEARVDIYAQISKVLPDFRGFFTPLQDNIVYTGVVDYPVSFGLAIFVKKTIAVDNHEDIFVFRHKNAREKDHTTMGKALEFITFTNNQGKFAIFNLHGLWNGQGKTDTPDRLGQAQKTREVLQKFSDYKIILCGDFNLLPETESLKIMGDGLLDLIKEYKITSTRSHFYTRPERFADYALVSPDLKIKNFAVLPDEVSDHLALAIEFS